MFQCKTICITLYFVKKKFLFSYAQLILKKKNPMKEAEQGFFSLTEVSKQEMNYSRSHSKLGIEPGPETKFSISQSRALSTSITEIGS